MDDKLKAELSRSYLFRRLLSLETSLFSVTAWFSLMSLYDNCLFFLRSNMLLIAMLTFVPMFYVLLICYHWTEHNKGKGTEHNDQIHMIRCRCRKVSINCEISNISKHHINNEIGRLIIEHLFWNKRKLKKKGWKASCYFVF